MDEDDPPCTSPGPSSDSLFSPRPKTPSSVESVRSPVTTCAPQKYKKKKDQMSPFETTFLDLAKSQSNRLDREYEKEKSRNAMDAFFESCALRARELSKTKQGWLQTQVSMLIYTAENTDTLPLPGQFMWNQSNAFPSQQLVQSQPFLAQAPIQSNPFQPQSTAQRYSFQTPATQSHPFQTQASEQQSRPLPTQAPIQGNDENDDNPPIADILGIAMNTLQ